MYIYNFKVTYTGIPTLGKMQPYGNITITENCNTIYVRLPLLFAVFKIQMLEMYILLLYASTYLLRLDTKYTLQMLRFHRACYPV